MHFHAEPLEMVKKAADLLPSESSVLDLAVGEGRHALYLLEKGHRVTGVDISSERIQHLQEQTLGKPITLIQANALEYQPDGLYDLVICTGLLHFFTIQQGERVINTIQSCTKKGGYNIIAARMDQNPRQSLTHVFAPEELKKYYSDWQIVEYEEADMTDFPPRKIEVILCKKRTQK